MSFTYEYPHFAVAVDIVAFRFDGEKLLLGLEKRTKEPFRDHWALPGGYVHADERGADTCARVLERFNLSLTFIKQLETFDAPDRDPRERVFSIAYVAGVPHGDVAGNNLEWFEPNRVDRLSRVAFDHRQIVTRAIARIQSLVTYDPAGLRLLPKPFSVAQALKLYEAVLLRPIDKRNFYKRFNALSCIRKAGTETGQRGAPKATYQLKTEEASEFQLP